MALTDENNMIMPVAPMYGSGGNGFGDGFGGSGWWILLLFILLGGNGWGNGFGGFGGGGELYPWMNQSNQINGGFRDQMLNTSINGIQNSITAGFGDVQTALCSGFAGVNAGISNGFAQAEIANNSRQMANMNQVFGLQSALQNCCCENRAGIADLKYTVATENCKDRSVLSDGIRDVIASQTASTQRILDQMCQDKIDAKNEEIANLRQQLNMASLAASQNAQTAQIRAGQVAEIDAMYQRLKDCPVPTMPVYGQTPIFTCPGSGCGCGSF